MISANSYYDRYTNLVNHTTIENALKEGLENIEQYFDNLADAKWSYRYAPEKWSIKEVVQHLIDSERIFAFRALCMARGETQNLPAFDENQYAHNSMADYRTPEAIIAEYKIVRQGTISLFGSFSDGQLQKTGVANNSLFNVGQQGYIIAGHEMHHLNVLKERY